MSDSDNTVAASWLRPSFQQHEPERHLTHIELMDTSTHSELGVRYTSVKPALSTRRPPPDYLFGPIPREFGRWYFYDRGAPEVRLFALSDVEFFGNRLLVRNDSILCLPQNGLHRSDMANDLAAYKSGAGLSRRSLDGEFVLLAGVAYGIYGHWLIDFMMRLQVLIVSGYDITKCKYLLPSDISNFVRDWLSILGINERQFVFFDIERDICHIKNALLPSNLRGNGRVSPLLERAAVAIRHEVLKNEIPPTDAIRKIYISRRKWGNVHRSLRNSDEIEQIADALGFQIVYPEEMSIRKQVQMFAHAEFVIGEYGSAMHSSIFCQSTSRLLMLRGNAGHPGFLQSGLCEAFRQRHGYVFGQVSEDDPLGSFVIDPTDFRMCVEVMQQ